MQPQQVNCHIILHRTGSYCSCNTSLASLMMFPSQLPTSGINQAQSGLNLSCSTDAFALCSIFQFKENGIKMFSQAQNVLIVAVDGNTYANNLGIPGLQVFSITIIRINLQTRKNFQVPSSFFS